MRIRTLELKNFRNYRLQKVEFGDGLNVLYGKNASGKTNMLESIFVCSVFSSPRTVKDKEMVLFGEDRAVVKAVVEQKYRSHTITLQIDSANKKKVLVDGIPIARAAELLGILGVVFFSPDELKLVKESPSERRRFMDIALSQQQKLYFAALQKYNKTLAQKNKLLKEHAMDANVNDMLEIWDASLAECGAVIVERRTQYLENLNPIAAEKHKKLSENKELLKLSYETDVKLEGNLRDNILSALRASREKDKILGFSTVGPHRDDIKIELDTRDSRRFASQGQQRTIALAMKLAEVEMFRVEVGEPPVLLLDDVLSELDEERQRLLLTEIKDMQAVLTCTEYTLDVPARKIYIADGTAKKIDKK